MSMFGESPRDFLVFGNKMYFPCFALQTSVASDVYVLTILCLSFQRRRLHCWMFNEFRSTESLRRQSWPHNLHCATTSQLSHSHSS